MNMYFTSLCLLALLPVGGAKIVEDGTNSEFWVDHAVIYARLERIEPRDRPQRARFTLDVRATLAGGLDAAQLGVIEVDVSFDRRFNTNKPDIEPGSMVIAVLHQDGKRFSTPSGLFTFMPGQAGVFSVKDLDDELVKRLIVRLRELRAKKAEKS